MEQLSALSDYQFSILCRMAYQDPKSLSQDVLESKAHT